MKFTCQDNNNGDEDEEKEDGNCNGKYDCTSSTNQKKKKKKIKIIKRTKKFSFSLYTFLFFFLSSPVLFVILLPHEYHIFVVALQQPKPPLTTTTTTTAATTTTIKTVRGLPVHRVPLRQQQQSPYCYALSSITDLPSRSNFLATQVWPSARVAAKILEERFLIGDIFTTTSSTRKIIRDNDNNDNNDNDDESTKKKKKFTICEFGCGPGLPSLTVAAAAAATSTTEVHVIATDVDEYALDLVNAAAIEQGLDSSMISTRTYDLINGNDNDNNENENECCWMDDVDLFVMSDVFESAAVAIGAARLTYRVLYKKNTTTTTRSNNNNDNNNKAKFFVFSQNDRVQRDVYIRELRNLIQQSKEKEEGNIGGDQRDDDDELISSSSLPSLSLLNWSTPESYNPDDLLWLCEVDETQVNYG